MIVSMGATVHAIKDAQIVVALHAGVLVIPIVAHPVAVDVLEHVSMRELEGFNND